ncbi:hypothetical protein [Natronorubrum aibiense]|uniref:Polysaccharide lyase-like protein n=1 Tax=Natronorubrum aibiense TaxID=348826 RepID=A0A5P9P147_9EURY|nr:hypothetical protein [Natronorubrum aibiense]QFU81868.1 hypothetical protein GCU68_04605 [Natronorubrum aibiense]
MDTTTNSRDGHGSDDCDRTDVSEPTASASVTRRRTLRLGGLLGAGSLLGVTGTAVDSASAACNRPDEVIHLDYDDYESWTDIYWLSNGDPDNLTFVSSPTNSGATALQLRIREDDHWGASTHYQFDDGLLELNGRVSFALNSNWSMEGRQPSNCRLWNCAIALGDGSAGGGVPDGTNGWSNRLYVTSRDTDPEGPFHLLSNTYHVDNGAGVGDHDYIIDGEPHTLATPEIEPGVWYEFEYYICVNTKTDDEANDDGIVRYWLDGDPIYERTDFRFTTDLEDNIIDTTGPVGHYGGRYEAPKNLYAYYDDHSMALDGTFESRGCGGPSQQPTALSDLLSRLRE